MTASEFFVRESVAHARTLPMEAALTFLRGMLVMTRGDSESAPVRQAFNHLLESDRQLELIASGQLKLALPEQPRKGRK